MPRIDEARFVRALRGRDRRDRGARARAAPSRRIFFGGGTPSLMQPATVGAILDAIARHWTVAPDAEVTLEANPTSVEATRFRGYRAAGVNRVSLGVQALDDACAQGARPAAHRARSARRGRDRALDLRALFVRSHLCAAGPDAGTPGRAELKRAIAEAGEHLSLYQLTIEQDTPFFALHARRQARHARRRHRARALRHDAGGLRGRRACRPTRSPTTRGRAPSAGTIWSIGARTNMPASGRARTAGSTSTASATPPRPRSGRRAWLMRVEVARAWARHRRGCSRSEERADEFLLMGLAARRRHRSARATRRSPAGRSIRTRIAVLRRRRRGRDDRERHAAGDAGGLSRCSTRWSPISRRNARRLRLAERLRRRADDLAARRRHPHHRQPALVGAVGPEAEQRRRCR